MYLLFPQNDGNFVVYKDNVHRAWYYGPIDASFFKNLRDERLKEMDRLKRVSKAFPVGKPVSQKLMAVDSARRMKGRS